MGLVPVHQEHLDESLVGAALVCLVIVVGKVDSAGLIMIISAQLLGPCGKGSTQFGLHPGHIHQLDKTPVEQAARHKGPGHFFALYTGCSLALSLYRNVLIFRGGAVDSQLSEPGIGSVPDTFCSGSVFVIYAPYPALLGPGVEAQIIKLRPALGTQREGRQQRQQQADQFG